MKHIRNSRLIQAAIVLALLVTASAAFALIEPKHVNTELRTRLLSYPGMAVTAAGDVTTGLNGVIAVQTTNTTDGGNTDSGFIADAGAGADAQAADAYSTVIAAAQISGVPYAAPLKVILIDGGTASTLTCTSVTIRGRDQFDRNISEVVSSIVETTPVYTLNAFSSVSAITTVGCSAGNSDLDFLQVGMGTKIGLLTKIRQAADIEAASFVDSDSSNDVRTYTGAELLTAAAISIPYNTVDLGDSSLTTAVADGDSVTVRVRPNPALP